MIRNNAQQSDHRKRRGIDVPWGGPPSVRRKKPKAEKPPAPQLALSFSPSQIPFPETHVTNV